MKIAVLTSGGVDSSVVLRLLKDEGHDLTAFYLKIWLEEDMAALGDCPWEDDLQFIRSICERHDIPLRVIPLQSEYFKRVISVAIEELKKGRTPSPDILCNERIKFGAFFDKIGDGFEKIATGHYAVLERIHSDYYLKRAKDPVKDQTYFLSHLNQKQLARLIFPLGGLEKKEVRRLARDYDLPNKDRKDSQGICFLGKIKYNDFVRCYLGEKPGSIVEHGTGQTLGEHKGFWFYTVGQRQGLGLPGGPWYVVGKDTADNTVFVSNKSDMPEKQRRKFFVDELHWIGRPPSRNDLSVKIRHTEKLNRCRIDRNEKSEALVEMDEEDPGIAPGQSAVFYDGDICLGSGLITDKAGQSLPLTAEKTKAIL